MKQEIPIFFSTDDTYIPYLDVAIASLIANASDHYRYKLIVLNVGLQPENIALVMQNQREGFAIEFIDISRHLESVTAHFKNVYHFSIATYYRLFIASLFPQYDKIIYLDCDLVVLGDISKLYETPLGENILGACPEEYVQNTAEFRRYAEVALGVNPDRYVNAGVLVINLTEYRKMRIEEQFVELITKHDFDLLDPEQPRVYREVHHRVQQGCADPQTLLSHRLFAHAVYPEYLRVDDCLPCCGGKFILEHPAHHRPALQYPKAESRFAENAEKKYG